MKKKFTWFAIFGFLLICLFSCSTLQEDVEVYMASEEQAPEIRAIEQELVFLEVSYLLDSTSISSSQTDEIIKKLDKLLGNVNLQTASQAKLLAFQGRLFLISNRPSLAKEYYQQSLSTYQGEVQNIILGNRLGLIEDLSTQKVAKSQMPYLILEMAIDAYKTEDYLQAIAKFDEAFISLDDFYREAYETLRNEAWKLRNISSDLGSREVNVLKQNSMTIGQMLSFIQNSTDVLFRFTGSKKYSEEGLFKQLLNTQLLYPLNGEKEESLLSKDEVLSRRYAARFLWNLYLEKNGGSGNINYAEQFAKMGFSPILDLPLTSPDFDAILGCVEKEFLDLPDGENFFPEEAMNPMDFSESINKIK